MATSDRTFNLFTTEDWRKVYETFRDADFQSYDYETLRKSMIDYLRLYYPEDFNDFIESSEYIALIDLMAFLGQSLAFRTDMNARENFLETAERRDSILKLARMLSYNPKRTSTARGFVKLDSVRTSERVFDSNGFDLSNSTIIWDDPANSDFLEQFTLVLNAAMTSSQRFGQPGYRDTINGIRVEEYAINIVSNTTPIYRWQTPVGGVPMQFELVNGTYSGQSFVYENPPIPGSSFNMIYRNDGRGNSSANTGFFMYFKQGQIQQNDFTISESIANRVVNINTGNVDQNDVWLYRLNAAGAVDEAWTKVPAVTGTSVIYNDIALDTRTVFAVNSRVNDRIDLVFGDGVFADIPVGNYRVVYRTGNGLSYKITPDDVQNILVNMPYVSRSGQLETLTLEFSLVGTVSNATTRENLIDVKTNAPQQYYTQNRMINGEDYNIFPITQYNDILKVKSINRTSSGISRYLDVRDTTGKYSSTNIFAEDGLFYRNEAVETFTFEWRNDNEILDVITGQVETRLEDASSQHFYYKNYPGLPLTTFGLTWNQTTTGTNLTTGYFLNTANNPTSIGGFVGSDLKQLKPGALIKFLPTAGSYFNQAGEMVVGTVGEPGSRDSIWTSITGVVADGANLGAGNLGDGTGPVTLNEIVPSDAALERVFPVFRTDISNDVQLQIISEIRQYREFGLRYDYENQVWVIITADNLDRANTFSLDNAGSTSGTGLDNSWFFLFETDGQTYTVSYRVLDYFWESVLETRFYFEPGQKIFDPRTGQTIKDNIRVLKVNSQPDTTTAFTQDYNLAITGTVVESDGWTDSTKIKVTFPDRDDDGVVDNPELFEVIIAPDVNPTDKLVFFRRVIDADNFERYEPLAAGTVNTDYATEAALRLELAAFPDGQVFWTTDEEQFWVLSISANDLREIEVSVDYRQRTGRQDMYFQYTHNSPNDRRIDPSPSNFVDMFVLTQSYDADFRAWIEDTTDTLTEPTPPTSFELRNSYGGLEAYKAVSDALIFNSAKYRALFGSKAEETLQATFKIVKNINTLKTDSEMQSRLIAAINEYFAIQNWDFGDTFYFSELAGYLHQELAPDLESVVIVPSAGDQSFGSLYQVTSQRDEIFVSAATVNNVEVIDSITASRLRATGDVVTSTTTNDTIVSSFGSTNIPDTNVGSTS